MTATTITDYRHAPAPVHDCECESHPDGAEFWITVKDGNRYAPVSGPYATHSDALAMVGAVRAWGENADPRAVFYAWGTTAYTSGMAPRTLNGRPCGMYEYLTAVDREASRLVRA